MILTGVLESGIAEVRNMKSFYESNPDLREYFESLPIKIKNQILESNVEITTLGELKKVAEHFKLMDKI